MYFAWCLDVVVVVVVVLLLLCVLVIYCYVRMNPRFEWHKAIAIRFFSQQE